MKSLPSTCALLLVGGVLSAGCNACEPNPPPPPRENQPDIVWCPGGPGCLTPGADDVFAGAGRRSVTPRGFEIANINYLRHQGGCDPAMVEIFGVDRCGELDETIRADCGRDGICPGDTGYTAPDADGTEGDYDAATNRFGRLDWFYDCGLDRICPNNAREVDNPDTPIDETSDGIDNDGDGAVDDGAYPGPDEGEADGEFQAAWIAGFGNNRPAMGVHDDVDVRCFALRTKQTTTAVCAIDAVGLFNVEVLRARELFKQRHGDLDLDYLAVQSSHTHESVDTLGQWGRADPLPTRTGTLAGHNAYIVDQIVAAAADAVRTLRRATISATETRTGADGYLRDGRDPQIMDDTMTLFEARARDDGSPIFTAVHWTNHPEIMGGDNNFISSDYAHPLREAIEGGLPATSARPAIGGRGGLAIYLNGTVGGIMTPLGVEVTSRDGVVYPGSPKTFARMAAYGHNLADAALTALGGAGVTSFDSAELQVKAHTFYIPVKNRVFIFAFAAGLFDRRVYDETGELIDTEVTSLLDVEGSAQTEAFTLDIGDISFMGVPGELFPEVAIGGYDGTWAFGRELVASDYCPPQSACDLKNGGDCPADRPADGYEDCDCEACRLCQPPNLERAPGGPYLKDRVPGRYKMVLGLANDELGYMVPEWDWKTSETTPYFCEAEGHYEETNSTGEFAVPRVLETFQRLFDFKL